MTPTEIHALSDAELVTRVAEKVMPKPIPVHGRCEVCGWPLAASREKGCVEGSCSMRPVPIKPMWSPLTDWNHTMQVVSAMRAKGWVFFMDNLTWKAVFASKTDSRAVNSDNLKRAVLESALGAMESAPQAASESAKEQG